MQRWIMWRGQHTLTALTFLKSSELIYAKIFVSACVCVCVWVGVDVGVGGRGGEAHIHVHVCVGVMKVFYVKALMQLSCSVALLCNTLVSYPGLGTDLAWWAQR